MSDAFKQAGLPWAELIIAAAGVAGITSVLLVLMLSAPRVFLAMARDGMVPPGFFADVHPRFRTPWKSTILVGVFVATMTGFLPIDALLHMTNIGTLFAFLIVCAAVLVMRRTNPNAERPFRAPLYPLVPILGIVSCLMLMFSLPVENWYRLLGWMALGLVIYFSYGYSQRARGTTRTSAFRAPPGVSTTERTAASAMPAASARGTAAASTEHARPHPGWRGRRRQIRAESVPPSTPLPRESPAARSRIVRSSARTRHRKSAQQAGSAGGGLRATSSGCRRRVAGRSPESSM